MKKGRESDGKRLKRILKLHQLLRSHKRFSTEQLQEAYFDLTQEWVELKTLQNDLRFMRKELHAPLPEKANKHKGYYYDDNESYSILEALDDSYYGTLNEAIALLRQASKSKEFMGLEDILLRLEQRISVTEAEKSTTIEFEAVELKGKELLPKIYQTIQKEHFLRIRYAPFNQPAYERHLFPLLLKEYNKRWFLIGWENGKAEPQTLAIDRIEAMRESQFDRFSFEKNKVWKRQFEDMIGVTFEGALETVILRFSANRFPYVETKKLHKSQKMLKKQAHTISLQVYTNRELKAKILEYGADVEVLAPETLRQEIAETLRRASAWYESI
ncbi:MAG: helix-turn-helix transcriptional regulator [Runella zeae]